MKLRKVTFKKGYPDGYKPGQTQEERDANKEMTREREGYFHCWTPAFEFDAETCKKVPTTKAIIEDKEDSKLYELSIKLFDFVNPPSYEER